MIAVTSWVRVTYMLWMIARMDYREGGYCGNGDDQEARTTSEDTGSRPDRVRLHL